MDKAQKAISKETTKPIEVAAKSEEPESEGFLGKWARRNATRSRKFLYAFWMLAGLVWLLVPISAYLSWWLGLPGIWQWAGTGWLKILAALLGTLFLMGIPLWIAVAAYELSEFVAAMDLGSSSAYIAVTRERVRETEEDALNRLESTDQANLLPLLRYSRAQLDAYYAIGLAQTRRSFVNAVIAMWLGFLILILGVVLYLAPVEQFGIQRPSEDFYILILSSATIVEVISALFLWVYRSTTNQLTFYYRLQMRSHTAILCFRMTTTMAKPDEAKQAIIDSMLDSTLIPEPTLPIGSKGLAALAARAQGA